MHYTIPLDIAMGLAYICMVYGLPYLMTNKRGSWQRVKRSHIIQVIVFALIALGIATLIPDPILANRRLHAIGGGVIIAYAYYLAVQDSQTPMSTVQYMIIGIMICNMAGIANELAESVVQSTISIIFAPTIGDTWRDLWANVIGSSIIIGLTTRYRDSSHCKHTIS